MNASFQANIDSIINILDFELSRLETTLKKLQIEIQTLDGFDQFERQFIQQTIQEQIDHNLQQQNKIINDLSAVENFQSVVNRIHAGSRQQ